MPARIFDSDLPEVKIIEPEVFGDERGFFVETWRSTYAEAGVGGTFVQDNLSRSARGILRGLHLQNPFLQGKLVYCVEGEVFDVAVDVRVGSPRFGRWMGLTLPAAARRQLYIPEGFAHGFCVTSDYAVVAYKCTELYHPETELGVAWDDPDLGIRWPATDVTLSKRDRALPRLRDISKARLPVYLPE